MPAAVESKRARRVQDGVSEMLYDEHPYNKGYWISELESLGICPKRTSELDIQELSDFVENLKQVFLEEYRSAYHHDNSDYDDGNDDYNNKVNAKTSYNDS
jgi:hypothetical protein